MNNIDVLIAKLKEEIYKDPLIKEYFTMHPDFDCTCTNEEINKKILELLFLKKCNPVNEEKERYYKIKNELDKNPLVYNFKIVEEEVNNYKKEIKEILEEL